MFFLVELIMVHKAYEFTDKKFLILNILLKIQVKKNVNHQNLA